MSELPDARNIPQAKLRPLLDKVRAKVKNHPVVKEMFKEHGVDLKEIDMIPMCFAKMNVSAQTNHGVIYFNIKLVEDGNFDDDDHYLVHEMTHILQQCYGDHPSKGANDGNYLDNEDEVEGFQKQVEYLADTRDEEEAEKYIEQVLDHHDVKDEGEREERKDELMALTRQTRFDELLKLSNNKFAY